MWRTFVPVLNMPIIYDLPPLPRHGRPARPSLETGGVLWFTDLAAADPFYIMPALSAGVLFFVMRR